MERLKTGIAALIVLASVACHATSSAQQPAPQPLAGARQLVVVTTSAWDSTGGVLRRFTRDGTEAAWQQVGDAVPIVVGRTGLAWGVPYDSVAVSQEPHKREGDGRSPAGVFPIGTAFGFAAPESVSLKLHYLALTTAVECVDDTASQYYNQVVDRQRVSAVDWSSSEKMRAVRQYKLGAVIDYNQAPVKGRGSCIFFHIWGGPASSTVGCTAMDEVRLTELIAWLDPRAQPVVVQLPAAAYRRMMQGWSLPSLPDPAQ